MDAVLLAGFGLSAGVDKYWAVVIVAHALYGAFEWTRYRNFLEKGEVCIPNLDSFTAHSEPLSIC